MAKGIYIDLNDGRPPMEITAGLRAPSFCMRTPDDFNGRTRTITGLVSGSQVIFIPDVGCVFTYIGTDTIPTIVNLKSISISGGSITMNNDAGNIGNFDKKCFPGTVMQILPASSATNGIGLFVASSTDFTAITTSTRLLTCVASGVKTVTGATTVSAIAGKTISAGAIMFAKWDNSGVSVTKSGANIWVNNITDAFPVDASVSMTYAIFDNVDPVPGRGITIMAGSRCVFSTVSRPFVYSGAAWTPSWNNTAIGSRMVLLGTFGMATTYSGNRNILKHAGIRMSGGNVALERGKDIEWWVDSAFTGRDQIGISLPLLDPIY
ncbi:DUF6453 family protein [Trabulsiella odontotermitis]|uniref:DUF6453 family protein n=1 Tax=Trabulsiella odontotermitis TaxID=379893 RepID=UPI0024B70F69|nr:DUF6453 family protein [Trabulsiella odontotermitis]WHP32847.1 DUF6453 family protein [Trabulsiella odontotermitis]